MKNIMNRLTRLEARIPKPKEKPLLIISRGHINKGNEPCILCGKTYFSSKCEKALSDEDLHKYMEQHKDTYTLFLWHETMQLDPFKFIALDTDSGMEYTGFILVPELSSDDITVKYFSNIE